MFKDNLFSEHQVCISSKALFKSQQSAVLLIFEVQQMWLCIFFMFIETKKVTFSLQNCVVQFIEDLRKVGAYHVDLIMQIKITGNELSNTKKG